VLPTLGGVYGALIPVMSGCGGLQPDWHEQHGTLRGVASDADQDNPRIRFKHARLAALARPVFS
jgi:hypothetical protein